MIRSKSEIIKMESELNESVNASKDEFEIAEKHWSPCLSEAKECLAAHEKKLESFMKFKNLSLSAIRKALDETEEKFISDVAEILSYGEKVLSDNPEDNEEMEIFISPAFAYDKEGEPILPPHANDVRKRANLLWHRKYILEWLLKTS